jgi:hypothetical protein
MSNFAASSPIFRRLTGANSTATDSRALASRIAAEHAVALVVRLALDVALRRQRVAPVLLHLEVDVRRAAGVFHRA